MDRAEAVLLVLGRALDFGPQEEEAAGKEQDEQEGEKGGEGEQEGMGMEEEEEEEAAWKMCQRPQSLRLTVCWA